MNEYFCFADTAYHYVQCDGIPICTNFIKFGPAISSYTLELNDKTIQITRVFKFSTDIAV